ncbi:MAG: hypothetical protein WA137_10550 [Methanothrix sp.]
MKTKTILEILIAIPAIMGIASAGDIQMPTDPEGVTLLAEQGYTPIILTDDSGAKSVIMLQGYTAVQVSSTLSMSAISPDNGEPTAKGPFSVASWIFRLLLWPYPLNEPEVVQPVKPVDPADQPGGENYPSYNNPPAEEPYYIGPADTNEVPITENPNNAPQNTNPWPIEI